MNNKISLLEKKITKVYLDRGSYKFHGRIKIFADALKKYGLKAYMESRAD